MIQMAADKFVDAFLTVVIAAALFLPLQGWTSDAAANASTTGALLWNLVPIFYVIAVVYILVKMIKK